ADDCFAYRGRWTLDYQGATAESDDSTIALKYNAKDVYIVVGGEGSLTITSNGKTTTMPITGAPTSHQLVSGESMQRGLLEVRLSKGLQAFSFTYG
ncbi:MAG: cytochrome c biogenesis protein DipZ, partial [Mycobacterium sp.]